nr:PREDICTED: aminopeptidase N-like isoform X1 [Linepithema humile]
MHLDNLQLKVYVIEEFISNLIAKRNNYPVLYVTRNLITGITEFNYVTSDFINKDTKHLPAFVTYTIRSLINFETIFPSKSFWLSPQKPEKLLEIHDEHDWIVVNIQQTGYYRVNYDTENWRKLAQHMNSTNYIDIHVLNRAQIIDDAFHFFIHKQLDYVTFWNISAFLSRETNYVVWYPMFKAFEQMAVMISIKGANNVMEKMESILSGVLNQIKYKPQPYESDLTECLREEAVKWACIIANKECREVAHMQMTRDLYSESDIFVTQSEWKGWMYCNGLVSANSTIWYDVWDKWAATDDIKFLEYLTCSEDPGVISNYLLLNSINSFLLQHDNTRAHIFFLIVAKHANNDMVCDFILQNLNNNTLMFTSNTQRDKIAIFIVMITHQHAVKQINKVLEFVKTNLKEKRLVDAVEKKGKKRRDEYGRQVRNYGIVGLRGFK